MTFKLSELDRQTTFFASLPSEQTGFGGAIHRLQAGHHAVNLAPAAQGAVDYFADNRIAWHRHANHALSSQVCCLNFLFPLASRPDLLARFVQAAVGGSPVTILPATHDSPMLVDFEWIPCKDHLNEWPAKGRPTRGANVTSVDAFVRFEQDGRRQALMIEWKYTEADAGPIADSGVLPSLDGAVRGNAKRKQRYEALAFAPNGPIRNDLGLELEDFFFHPFYQLQRQAMLAHLVERDPDDPASHVRLLHVAPSGNLAVRRIKGATKLAEIATDIGTTDAFAAFRHVLVNPDAFLSRSTHSLFGPLLAECGPDDSWAAWLRVRYAFLGDAEPSSAAG